MDSVMPSRPTPLPFERAASKQNTALSPKGQNAVAKSSSHRIKTLTTLAGATTCATVAALQLAQKPLGPWSRSANQVVVAGGALASAFILGTRKAATKNLLQRQALASCAATASIAAALVSLLQSPQSRLLLCDASAAILNLCIFSQALRRDVGRSKASASDASIRNRMGRYIPHSIVATSILYLALRMVLDGQEAINFFGDKLAKRESISTLAAHCSQPTVSAIVYPLLLKQLRKSGAQHAQGQSPVAQGVIMGAYVLVGINCVYVLGRVSVA